MGPPGVPKDVFTSRCALALDGVSAKKVHLFFWGFLSSINFALSHDRMVEIDKDWTTQRFISFGAPLPVV
jgi:hypothetical protein